MSIPPSTGSGPRSESTSCDMFEAPQRERERGINPLKRSKKWKGVRLSGANKKLEESSNWVKQPIRDLELVAGLYTAMNVV